MTVGALTAMTPEDRARWIADSGKKRKPLAEYIARAFHPALAERAGLILIDKGEA